MKAIFLVPRLDKASTRFRVLNYIPFLENFGWECKVIPFAGVKRDWSRLSQSLLWADLTVVQKKLFNPIELAIIRKLSKKLIYDFDDAVMFKEGAQGENFYPRQFKRFVRTIKHVDLVIAGNSFLAEQAKKHHDRVYILPTPIDTEHYQLKDHSKVQDEISIGWIGSRGTLKYLKNISGALDRLYSSFPHVRLKIVADEFLNLSKMPVIKKQWSQADEVLDLQSFDIGLMPLPDDLWTRGKCGFKLLQCMATGLPVVCSPIGVNKEIVAEGLEGFWASNEDEWVKKLSLLVNNGELRKEMGKKGRYKVEKKFSLYECAPKMNDLLKMVLKK